MKRLTYRKVFEKYSLSLSDRLACLAYSFYKRIRVGLLKIHPLKEYEKDRFEDCLAGEKYSDDMPLGFDYSNSKEENGYINLKYIDFYDYLPKEEIGSFWKAWRKFAFRNKQTPFGRYYTTKDEKSIDGFGRYIDRKYFTLLPIIKLTHNKYLGQYANQIGVTLRNLSPSFLVVKYRFYINKKFNEKYNSICKTKYQPFAEVSRRFDTKWYKPHKFGTATYTGNNAREKELYLLLSVLKWNAFIELKRYFSIFFERDCFFPPTFETYSTNIRPDKSRDKLEFWNSVGLGHHPDYALKYNTCINWDYIGSQYEGIKLSAYCGGDYSSVDFLPGIVESDISDLYAVVLTSSNIRRIAERDIALYNRKISKVIRKAKAEAILKVRVDVERALYYSYRFISEFTGDTIDHIEKDDFRSNLHGDSSSTEKILNGISESTKETKKQIDALLHVLNDAAEYGGTMTNINLQRTMAAATIISLILAISAMFGFNFSSLKSLWEAICISWR